MGSGVPHQTAFPMGPIDSNSDYYDIAEIKAKYQRKRKQGSKDPVAA